jgi:2-polyprenyl-6-methoxyphenol hydroxylase-like FAD-dependent oxidoreductase
MKAVVVGAGVAGLGAALALSRAGHEVVVLERDRTPLPHDPDQAFEWDRRGAPQVRHSHALLARLRNLLRDRYPDVLEALFAAGVTEWPLTTDMPPTIDDPAPKPGDEDLVMLACRRTTFEWVLRRAVLTAPHVELLDGVVVDGFTGEGNIVTGVHARRDDEALPIEADMVVAATGRRGDVPAWLAPLGVTITETEEDTGIVYLSRFYRLRPGAEPPPQTGPIGGDLGYLKYATFPGDNRTFSVTLATGSHDDQLRKMLLDPETFDRTGRILPATSAWLEADRSEPITPVHVMAKLLNRLRTFADGDGAPRVLGFHAIGDAHTCTNPIYGRGCSLAMVQATLLADACAEHPDDAMARARAYEEASAREVEPWYHAAIAQDRQARAAESGASADEDPMRAIMRDGLLPAMRTDNVVLRAFLRTFNLLTTPDALLQDPDVIGRVLSAYQDRESRPPEPVLGPPRDELLAQLA